ncbi:MAG: MerR family transcriptional regulator, partial [Deltaproteobacteria bacterium]|nr:MerR family transcriptional regulator [Deltaproteobacteria bacterium]
NSKTVSRLVDVTLRQIQYWDEQGFIRPTVRPASGRGSQRLYSFSDLVKLKVVKNLSDHGLSLQGIRSCLTHLKDYSRPEEKVTDSLKFLTDGKKLFVLTDDSKTILGALDREFVFSLAIGNLVR